MKKITLFLAIISIAVLVYGIVTSKNINNKPELAVNNINELGIYEAMFYNSVVNKMVYFSPHGNMIVTNIGYAGKDGNLFYLKTLNNNIYIYNDAKILF